MRGAVALSARKSLTWLAVLLVIVMSAGVSQAKRRADPGADWGTFQLANVGDEPIAFGRATLTNVQPVYGDVWGLDPAYWIPLPYYWATEYQGQLVVTCRNLQPGARYSVSLTWPLPFWWDLGESGSSFLGAFQANRKGGGKAAAAVDFVVTGYYGDWSGPSWVEPAVVTVDRLYSDGSSVTVLRCEISGPAN